MNYYRQPALSLTLAMPCILCAGIVSAQHSDVEFGYDNGKIEVEFGPEGRVFEGEFPTAGVDLQYATEPGFESDPAEGLGLNPGDEIAYNLLSGLLFWDGFTISNAPAGTQVRVENRGLGVPDTIITGSSSAQHGSFASPFNNRIGAADAAGVFHSDLDWFLEPNPGSPATGAYAVKLSLSTDEPGIEDSDPFFIIHNFGLSETAFESGVEAFAAQVPEPASTGLVAGGLLFGLLRRRR